MLSRFVIAFLPSSKDLLISWLQSSSAVVLESKKIKSVTVSIISPPICQEVMGSDAMIFVFWMLSFKPAFALSSPSSRGSLVPLCFLPLRWFSSVQSLSCVQLIVTPWTAACQASLFITNSWSLLKLISIKSVMPSNHLILYRPLLHLPSIFPSTRVFSNESVLCIRWPEYWSFSFNISPSNEYWGLISLRIDCLDFLAVQGTLKSLLQHHSSKT